MIAENHDNLFVVIHYLQYGNWCVALLIDSNCLTSVVIRRFSEIRLTLKSEDVKMHRLQHTGKSMRFHLSDIGRVLFNTLLDIH